MRLLYILPAEGFGGAERQGALHIADLPRVGVEVVAATGPGQPIQVQLARAGVRDYVLCREFPDARVSSRGWRASLARPWLYARSWRRSVRALTSLGRQRRVDAVFACRAFGWTVGSAVARRLGVPVIWRAGSHPASQAHAFALRHLARRIAPDLLIANSESGRRAYAEALGVPTTILYNAVDTERFSPGRASPRVRLDLGLGTIPVIGLAARPAPEKGLDCLAEVARRISHRFPTARFLVAGEFPLRAHYQQTFAALGQD
jgi:glycosyltransferase involved in cell wall biosynthesis